MLNCFNKITNRCKQLTVVLLYEETKIALFTLFSSFVLIKFRKILLKSCFSVFFGYNLSNSHFRPSLWGIFIIRMAFPIRFHNQQIFVQHTHILEALCDASLSSNETVTKSGIMLILQSFRHFTYVTTHSPTLPSLYLRHQLISQPFCCFTYVTVHSPTLLSLFLCLKLFT